MTTKLFVPDKDFRQVNTAIKNSGVKFYPYDKQQDGYVINIEPDDHPLVTYLILKYDINII